MDDKLSHAILSVSACVGLPGCGCRAPNGHVVVKRRLTQGGGHGEPATPQAMADVWGLHTILATLEDLEGHLHFIHADDSHGLILLKLNEITEKKKNGDRQEEEGRNHIRRRRKELEENKKERGREEGEGSSQGIRRRRRRRRRNLS